MAIPSKNWCSTIAMVSVHNSSSGHTPTAKPTKMLWIDAPHSKKMMESTRFACSTCKVLSLMRAHAESSLCADEWGVVAADEMGALLISIKWEWAWWCWWECVLCCWWWWWYWWSPLGMVEVCWDRLRICCAVESNCARELLLSSLMST